MKRILLVDTLNSAFFLKHSKEPNVIWRFLSDIRDVAARFKVNQVVFVYEGAGGSRYRKELYPEYKFKRKELREKSSVADKKAYDTFIKQVGELIKVAPLFGIKTVNVDEAEADDTIAYIINRCDLSLYQILLMSSDTDLNQLLRPNVIQGTYGKELSQGIKAGKIPASIFMNEKEFLQENGIVPLQYTEAKCLSGDTADSISGFSGVGQKLATDLIKKYRSIYLLEKNLDNLDVPRLPEKAKEDLKKRFREVVDRNYKLINLNWGIEGYTEILGKKGVEKLDGFIQDLDKPLQVNKKALEEYCYECGRVDIVDRLDFFLHPFGGV